MIWTKPKSHTQWVEIMSGSCHWDRASNVEIGVVYQIFVIVIFFNCGESYNAGHIQDIIFGCLNSKEMMFKTNIQH